MSLRLSSLAALPAVASLFFAAACSSAVTGGTGGTGSGTGATSTSSGSGGAASTSSGSGGTATTSTTSTTSSSGGTGGSSACAGFLDVTEMGSAPQHFAWICAGSWGSSETMTAIGYHFSGGAFPGADEIVIHGCAGPGANAPGLQLSTPKVSAPGTYLDGSASYTGSNGFGSSTGPDAYKVVITKLDEPGGVIEGTFAVTVTSPNDAKKSLTGSFHVCRVMDLNAP